MRKRLSISDILLLSLSGILDFFQEVRDTGSIITSYYQNFYGFVPSRWQKIHLQQSIYHNVKKRFIEKKAKKLKLTPLGKTYLKNKFPLFFSKNNRWERCFYLVIFDVEELKRNHRDYLRRLLKNQNFGMLQKSAWLTPHLVCLKSIEEFKKRFSLEREIICLKITFESEIVEKTVVKRCWPLEKLNLQYKTLYNQFNSIAAQYQKDSNLARLKENYLHLKKQLYQTILRDPFLPKELLPQPWYYFQAIKIKKSIATMIRNRD